MSPTSTSARAAEMPQRRRFGRPSLLAVVWLTVVWALLWGGFTPFRLLSGIVVALTVMVFLPLPSAGLKYTFRPIAALRLLLVFLRDLAVASWDVTVMLLTGRTPTGAVIRVKLHSHSDLFLSTTAGMISLVPGTVVVDAHRLTGTLYLHVLDANQKGGLQAAHDAALAQEERILRAFATDSMLTDSGYVPGGSMKAGRLNPHTGEVLRPATPQRGGEA